MRDFDSNSYLSILEKVSELQEFSLESSLNEKIKTFLSSRSSRSPKKVYDFCTQVAKEHNDRACDFIINVLDVEKTFKRPEL